MLNRDDMPYMQYNAELFVAVFLVTRWRGMLIFEIRVNVNSRPNSYELSQNISIDFLLDFLKVQCKMQNSKCKIEQIKLRIIIWASDNWLLGLLQFTFLAVH